MVFEVAPEFADVSTGILSISAFHTPRGFRPAPTAYREAAGMRGGAHMVDIVGVDLDPQTGRVIKYKIRNSWGQVSGDQGFYHMYADYFEHYFSYAYFQIARP